MVIGLGLAGSAIGNLTSRTETDPYNLLAILSGLVAMVVTGVCAHYGKKTLSLIPFVIGMGAGYAFALILTLIGYYGCGNEYFQIVNLDPIVKNFVDALGGEKPLSKDSVDTADSAAGVLKKLVERGIMRNDGGTVTSCLTR